VNTSTLLDLAELPRSSFYYKRTSGARGRKPSETIQTSNGEVVDNLQVVTHIEQTLEQEFCCYGYIEFSVLFSRCRLCRKRKKSEPIDEGT
jgi:hypothetical protein